MWGAHNMSNLSTDFWDSVNTWYYISGSVLAVMLIISEALAWMPRCKANAITQLYRCIDCINSNIDRPKPPEVPVPV